MTRYNPHNQTHVNGGSLFLGEDLGLHDTIHKQHPILEELYQKQLAQLWSEFEIDLTQDIMDMKALPHGVTDLMVKTVSWQWASDSIAGRSIGTLLGPYVSDSQLEGLLSLWSFFEVIHARTYSHIVKQTFVNPTEALNETHENIEVLTRLEPILAAFDAVEHLPKDASKEEKARHIVKAFVALFALEGIAFMASFATTFAIAERGHFQGIAQLVKLIARDEKLHTQMDYVILDIITKDPLFVKAIGQETNAIKEILDCVVENELRWADYAFSEGRQVVGLTPALLKQYVFFMSKPIFDVLGAPYEFEVVKHNPLPYMDDYLDGSKIQSAAQEIQITSYNVGAIVDDTNGLDLDDLF